MNYDDYIKEFEREGATFIFYDISSLKNNDEMQAFADEAKKRITRHEPKSVYVITSSISFFDTRTKEIGADWIVFNKPYVIASALVDISQTARIAAKSVYKRAERETAKPFNSIDSAVKWLLTQKQA